MNALRTACRALRPHRFTYVLYRAERLNAPETSGLRVDVVEPGQPLQADQRSYLERGQSRLGFHLMLRHQRRGIGWVFLATANGTLCHYTLASPARRYRRFFDAIREPRAVLIGPCGTDPGFRGRSIYPRVIAYAVAYLAERGHGPFYIHTDTANHASIRGMEKAGFQRCGVWRGWRALGTLLVHSRRSDD